MPDVMRGWWWDYLAECELMRLHRVQPLALGWARTLHHQRAAGLGRACRLLPAKGVG